MQKAQQNNLQLQHVNNDPITTTQIGSITKSRNQSVRLNPLLLRIYADDQDKKTLCLFWLVLFCVAFLIAMLAKFSVPSLYVGEQRRFQINDMNCSFPNSPVIKKQLVVCDNYYNTSQIGELIFDWSSANQFALTYLQIIPINLSTPLTLTTNLTISIYKIYAQQSQTQKDSILVQQEISVTSQILKFDSLSAQSLYSKDGRSIIGYSTQLAIIPHLDSSSIIISIKFNQTLDASLVQAIYLQSYAINKQFTYYTIIIRYIFFALSVFSLVLYYLRFRQIPKEKRITEQILVAIASILLIMFNDPFYSITVLKPNGGSAFFSIIFVVNLVVFLFFMWIVVVDRIHQQDGHIGTEQITKKKITYAVVIWLQLLVAMMVYSMQQINTAPILANNLETAYIAAKIIIILSFLVSIAYIVLRYVQICRSQQQILWRNNIFLVISSGFIFLIFIVVASNQLIPYNYTGSTILLVYGLVNVYVYYLQYMFTITKEEAQKLGKDRIESEDERLTALESINVIDINIKDAKEQSLEVKETNEQTKIQMNEKTQPMYQYYIE